ncbi:glycosyltransferase [Bordetella hinzii]|uniref:Glycosyltransferase, group 1 family protein n=1 Tax=Bordetella hinzii OH87 BAL007II TaxID=1331262 RepID=A0ABR4QZU3_9BORD|nr:glycosyltransferase [Bordetella hinzii]KCB23326.1 glycosyltransferase, group 1 family protein [Bordetella hinzii OH87 BAL007II]KCB26785.1 glycosyltransferase, group 1 family protein [Bordetella hinzii CA90 BAL1384]KCB28811.1 glycosyltransferase, group 1 family protein [Bordetella hinzii CA90 BAL1384]KCB42834.1 glycosyltransferase, group 1 family protein [Bordetella hinzii 5132]QDJ41259.1 glycosyltransferase [Bordetella hinzii]
MKRAERLLLVCYFDPKGIETVLDNIGYLQTYSNFHIDVLNLYGAPSALTRGRGYSLADYDGVIVHNTISYNPANLESLDRQLEPSLRQYDGIKVIFKQDEQYRTLAVADFIGSRGFDLVLTCVSETEREKVYPRHVVGDEVVFQQMYTGYVTPKLLARTSTNTDRPIDISYRGSLQPLYFGRLAYDKRQIGDDVLRRAADSRLTLDISSRWEDRLMGEDWFRFLANSKSTLGVESGASIFDFDGSVEKLCSELATRRNEFADEHSYSEWVLAQLQPYEGNVYYNQISPRHFEAGAARTLQVMYEGQYSDIFRPWQHFVPLDKDLGNFDQVCEYVLDPRLRGDITERVYEEIIRNPVYSMQHFVSQLDEAMAGLIDRKPRRSSPTHRSGTTPKRNALLLCAHPPAADPRVSWVADHGPGDIRIHVMGIGQPGIVERSTGALEIQLTKAQATSWIAGALASDERNPGLDALARLKLLADMSVKELEREAGTTVSPTRAHAFNWNCRHLLLATETLVQASLACAGYGVVIAADFDALIAAIILKHQRPGTRVFYDAHEFWPTSHGPDTENWEISIWQNLERSLLADVDASTSVSPQLATHMSAFYGHDFLTAPNCEPLEALNFEDRSSTRRTDQCVFLFQGNFMAGRGLELLIDAWPSTDSHAILELRGPDRSYKRELEQRARRVGLLDKRIFFPPAVDEAALVSAASAADVGLIPYEPSTLNSRFSSPNKLSQYMAAGLPVLANQLDFVAQVVTQAQSGQVIDFSQPDALVAAVNKLSHATSTRREQGDRGRVYFREYFHWEKQSEALYRALSDLLAGQRPAVFGFHPPTVTQTNRRSTKQAIIRLLGTLWRAVPAPIQTTLRPWLGKIAARLIR